MGPQSRQITQNSKTRDSRKRTHIDHIFFQDEDATLGHLLESSAELVKAQAKTPEEQAVAKLIEQQLISCTCNISSPFKPDLHLRIATKQGIDPKEILRHFLQNLESFYLHAAKKFTDAETRLATK
jgi:DNA-directed RNA polymerase subunit L